MLLILSAFTEQRKLNILLHVNNAFPIEF